MGSDEDDIQNIEVFKAVERSRESEKHPEELEPIRKPQAEANPEEVLAMSMLRIVLSDQK